MAERERERETRNERKAISSGKLSLFYCSSCHKTSPQGELKEEEDE
jgi:predicted RNA-binding protein with PUA-like domain